MALSNLDLEYLKSNNADDVVMKIWDEIPKDANGKAKSFPEHLCKIWPILKPLLIGAKVFTNEGVDKVIDLIVSAGDSMCKNN